MWGPRPPPQHGALVAGRLVLAAVGQAEGRTLVADVSSCLSALKSCQIHSLEGLRADECCTWGTLSLVQIPVLSQHGPARSPTFN